MLFRRSECTLQHFLLLDHRESGLQRRDPGILESLCLEVLERGRDFRAGLFIQLLPRGFTAIEPDNRLAVPVEERLGYLADL